jgi:hypothetical protein
VRQTDAAPGAARARLWARSVGLVAGGRSRVQFQAMAGGMRTRSPLELGSTSVPVGRRAPVSHPASMARCGNICPKNRQMMAHSRHALLPRIMPCTIKPRGCPIWGVIQSGARQHPSPAVTSHAKGGGTDGLAARTRPKVLSEVFTRHS